MALCSFMIIHRLSDYTIVVFFRFSYGTPQGHALDPVAYLTLVSRRAERASALSSSLVALVRIKKKEEAD